jgi:hypothetical protein
MLHKLESILDHPTYQMQQILEATVKAAVDNIPFDKNCFPISLESDWDDQWNSKNCFIYRLHNHLYEYIISLPDPYAFMHQFMNNNDIQKLCNDISIALIDNIVWDKTNENIVKFMLGCYEDLDLVMFRLGTEIQYPRKEFDTLFKKINRYVCPFCGLNNYPNELATQRSDFDHYIYKKDFPLSAANMQNLIPMCVECNRDVKKTVNPLMDKGRRTYAFYPYDDLPKMNISLECIDEPNVHNKNRGEWKIKIEPDLMNPIVDKKIETWDRVFKIKERYVNDIEIYHDFWINTELSEQKTKFIDIAELRAFMLNRMSHWRREVDIKMNPKSYIKMILFEYMAKEASERFLMRYFTSHNNFV